ncbi:hypothetical protein Trydic_g3586 [Trypoxylus dichotomus]
MRYFLLSICLYLAVTWTVDITVAIEQEKHAPPDSAFTSDNSEATLPDRNGNNVVDNGNIQYLAKRVPSGFFGLRGKKPFEGWVSSQEDDEIYNKRAPTGFFGLRGKKDMDYAMDFEKRVPSGFLGLRGKKFYDYMGLDDDEFPYYEKRIPSGFFGLRGKREYEDEIEDDKRAAPENRFFGMRGKKMPARNGFVGLRGKKYPYEFRGKFVGVRGKRLNDIGAPEKALSNYMTKFNVLSILPDIYRI